MTDEASHPNSPRPWRNAPGHLTHAQLEAEASARVRLANTSTELLRLARPEVSYAASTGVIGARELLEKINKVLKEAEHDA